MLPDAGDDMQKRILLGVGISGLVLAALCAIIYFIVTAPKPPEPAEVELGLNLSLPDNPIVFTISGNDPVTTLGFINPDGSSFTTRQIDISLTRDPRHYDLVDPTLWGPDGTFLVTRLTNAYWSTPGTGIPLVITGSGVTRRCNDVQLSGSVWGLDSTHMLINNPPYAGESDQIVILNMETCQIEDVIYTTSSAISDFAISSGGWIAYEATFYEYETDFFGRRTFTGHSIGSAMIVVDDQHREVFRVDNARSPNWSIDGEWLAYDIYREGIRIVNRSGSDTWLITDIGSDPWWSPDGEWLVYWTYDYEIYKINIITKEKVLLYNGGRYPTWR
jgi:hypothetical protein